MGREASRGFIAFLMKVEEVAGGGVELGGEPVRTAIGSVDGSAGRASSAGRQVTGEGAGLTEDALGEASETVRAQMSTGIFRNSYWAVV
ncbi:unnamed protein product [Urochloa humidicola]